ncbi:phosphoglycolate phosphatase [Pseudomonas cuatrocienegasensis]|uniref:Phosphoglycolate phosphatase n=1 Tax=Pseudomonas cuatrocienegasensis TaxID=543360 RepID=A0ABY1B0P6_9PSED|nr:HAD family hydrolase [Pseudomonas sp. 21C1]SEP64623.1 phosphoglycolate phosphatase [Pseudomonas cuatrocienegasensis]
MRSGVVPWSGWVPDYKLLIFDWDGTLVDSIGRIVLAMHHAADVCGWARRSDDEVRGIIGLGLPEAIAVLYPDVADAARIDGFRQHYAACYLRLEASPSPLFAGVVEALSAFRQEGRLLAVATGKGRPGLQRVLQAHGWHDYFDATRCADETASKPDPLMLQQILTQCGVAAHEALMVGDSVFDIQMAHRAGMHSVAVGCGAQPLSVLRAHQPTVALDTFAELSAWLARSSGLIEIGVSGHG